MRRETEWVKGEMCEKSVQWKLDNVSDIPRRVLFFLVFSFLMEDHYCLFLFLCYSISEKNLAPRRWVLQSFKWTAGSGRGRSAACNCRWYSQTAKHIILHCTVRSHNRLLHVQGDGYSQITEYRYNNNQRGLNAVPPPGQ